MKIDQRSTIAPAIPKTAHATGYQHHNARSKTRTDARLKFTSSKFDIKKYSWGQKEKLRQPPVYGAEIYMSIRYVPTFDYPGFGVSAFGALPFGY